MLIATWVIAIMTIFYTLGTFLLWLVTRKNIEKSEQAYKLYALAILALLEKPEFGMAQKDYERYAELKKSMWPEIEKLIKIEFPDLKLY